MTDTSKYQPDRPDILINSDYGIPESELSEPEADKRGMVKFRGRWVTNSDRSQLRREQLAYRAIRFLAIMVAFEALIFVAMGIKNYQGPLTYSRILVGLLAVLLFVALLVYAKCLWDFKRWALQWARWGCGLSIIGTTGIVLIMLCMLIYGLAIGEPPSRSDWIRLASFLGQLIIPTAVAAAILFNKTASYISFPYTSRKSGSVEYDHRAQEAHKVGSDQENRRETLGMANEKPERMARPSMASERIGKRQIFTCPGCGKAFTSEMTHCPFCGFVWLDDLGEDIVDHSQTCEAVTEEKAKKE